MLIGLMGLTAEHDKHDYYFFIVGISNVISHAKNLQNMNRFC